MSFKSKERNFRRNQDQYFSTGLRSGLRGGTRQSVTDARSWAGALLLRNDSLSHKTSHGPLAILFFSNANNQVPWHVGPPVILYTIVIKVSSNVIELDPAWNWGAPQVDARYPSVLWHASTRGADPPPLPP